MISRDYLTPVSSDSLITKVFCPSNVFAFIVNKHSIFINVSGTRQDNKKLLFFLFREGSNRVGGRIVRKEKKTRKSHFETRLIFILWAEEIIKGFKFVDLSFSRCLTV